MDERHSLEMLHPIDAHHLLLMVIECDDYGGARPAIVKRFDSFRVVRLDLATSTYALIGERCMTLFRDGNTYAMYERTLILQTRTLDLHSFTLHPRRGVLREATFERALYDAESFFESFLRCGDEIYVFMQKKRARHQYLDSLRIDCSLDLLRTFTTFDIAHKKRHDYKIKLPPALENLHRLKEWRFHEKDPTKIEDGRYLRVSLHDGDMLIERLELQSYIAIITRRSENCLSIKKLSCALIVIPTHWSPKRFAFSTILSIKQPTSHEC